MQRILSRLLASCYRIFPLLAYTILSIVDFPHHKYTNRIECVSLHTFISILSDFTVFLFVAPFVLSI